MVHAFLDENCDILRHASAMLRMNQTAFQEHPRKLRAKRLAFVT